MSADDEINITFGILSAILALIAIVFAALTWRYHRRSMRAQKMIRMHNPLTCLTFCSHLCIKMADTPLVL